MTLKIPMIWCSFRRKWKYENSEEMKRICTVGGRDVVEGGVGKGLGRGRRGGGRREENPRVPPPACMKLLIVQDSKLAWGASFCCSN